MTAAELRHDVETLAGMTRDSAGAGERAAAEWATAKLRQLGAQEVRTEAFRYQDTFAYAQGAHFAAGAFAALTGRRFLAAARSLPSSSTTAGAPWLRSVADSAKAPTAGAAATWAAQAQRWCSSRHDAAHRLMWDPRLLQAGDSAADRTGKRASLALVPEAAFIGAVLGGRRVRGLAALVLAAAVASAPTRRGATPCPAPTTTRAAWRARGRRARLAQERPDGLEVIVLLCGCEESGMGGMAAWMRSEGAQLDSATTLVLGLDTVGSGEPVVLEAEGGLWPVRCRESDVAFAERAAGRRRGAAAALAAGGWTDPVMARLGGLPSVSLLSVREGGFPTITCRAATPTRWTTAASRRVNASVAIARAHAA